MAKYHTIVREVEGSIRRGELKPFDQLPTVVELTKHYHVSRTTIEQALDELEKRGLISRKRGSGVYVKMVSERVSDAPLNTVSFSSSIDVAPGNVPSCEVHEFTVVKPDENIRMELGLHQYSFTFYVVRSHMHEDAAVDIQYVYYPVEIFRDVRIDAAQASLHDFLTQMYGVTPDSYHKTLRAVMPTDKERELLGLEEGVPLLEVEQVGYLDDGRPFEYSISRFKGNEAEYQTIDADSLPM